MKKEEIIELLKVLQCPISQGELTYNEEKHMLYSPGAKVFFPIEDGIPVLLESASIKEDEIFNK